jgi:diguanylate cyclase
MQISDLTHDELTKALSELDQALFHHEQWHEELNRTLICSLSPDQRDLEKDAHRNCRFGQWLYCGGPRGLATHPAFAEIEVLHQRLHNCARQLLIASANGEQISLQDYELFSNAVRQMRLEMLTTKHEIEDTIYNLDPLTGAASRIGMLTRLREQQALVKRKAQSCCVAMMDLDHFKNINDTYGHAMGDKVLSVLARHLKNQLRPYDMLFRYGGEEFLICLPSSDMKSGRDAVERLCQNLAAVHFKADGNTSFQVTVSFGLTLLDPDVSVETSIERADKALYAAKAAGRNCVRVWDASME